MDNQFRYSGWAMTLYGAVTFSTFLYTYTLIFTQLSLFESPSFIVVILFLFIFVISVSPLFCGIYLLKQNRKIHRYALPVSIVIMLAFPIGTFVGALYLWQRYKNT